MFHSGEPVSTSTLYLSGFERSPITPNATLAVYFSCWAAAQQRDSSQPPVYGVQLKMDEGQMDEPGEGLCRRKTFSPFVTSQRADVESLSASFCKVDFGR